jgi:hypothetical protein
MIAILVYILCSLGSLFVSIVLWKNYRRAGVRFLLWSSLCFLGLGLGNVILFIDIVLFPNGPDLSIVRMLPALAGYAVLIYGFIWDVV